MPEKQICIELDKVYTDQYEMLEGVRKQLLWHEGISGINIESKEKDNGHHVSGGSVVICFDDKETAKWFGKYVIGLKTFVSDTAEKIMRDSGNEIFWK